MSKADELLHFIMEAYHDEADEDMYYLAKRVDKHLKRKEKLVVGSEWVCDVDCYGALNGMSPLIVDSGMEVVVTSEDKNTFVQIEIDYCGIISSFQIPYNQFLVCFSPKENV